MRPEAIVLHRSGGTAEEIRVRFLDATTAISAHYVVAKDGGVWIPVDVRRTQIEHGLEIGLVVGSMKPSDHVDVLLRNTPSPRLQGWFKRNALTEPFELANQPLG